MRGVPGFKWLFALPSKAGGNCHSNRADQAGKEVSRTKRRLSPIWEQRSTSEDAASSCSRPRKRFRTALAVQRAQNPTILSEAASSSDNEEIEDPGSASIASEPSLDPNSDPSSEFLHQAAESEYNTPKRKEKRAKYRNASTEDEDEGEGEGNDGSTSCTTGPPSSGHVDSTPVSILSNDVSRIPWASIQETCSQPKNKAACSDDSNHRHEPENLDREGRTIFSSRRTEFLDSILNHLMTQTPNSDFARGSPSLNLGNISELNGVIDELSDRIQSLKQRVQNLERGNSDRVRMRRDALLAQKKSLGNLSRILFNASQTGRSSLATRNAQSSSSACSACRKIVQKLLTDVDREIAAGDLAPQTDSSEAE